MERTVKGIQKYQLLGVMFIKDVNVKAEKRAMEGGGAECRCFDSCVSRKMNVEW